MAMFTISMLNLGGCTYNGLLPLPITIPRKLGKCIRGELVWLSACQAQNLESAQLGKKKATNKNSGKQPRNKARRSLVAGRCLWRCVFFGGIRGGYYFSAKKPSVKTVRGIGVKEAQWRTGGAIGGAKLSPPKIFQITGVDWSSSPFWWSNKVFEWNFLKRLGGRDDVSALSFVVVWSWSHDSFLAWMRNVRQEWQKHICLIPLSAGWKKTRWNSHSFVWQAGATYVPISGSWMMISWRLKECLSEGGKSWVAKIFLQQTTPKVFIERTVFRFLMKSPSVGGEP